MKFILRDVWAVAMAFSESDVCGCGASHFKSSSQYNMQYAQPFKGNNRQPWGAYFSLRGYFGNQWQK